jgi:hypothetical protein
MLRSAYTLVELLVAMTLSLLLLLGVVEMFRNVGGAINDTQATLNMSANLDSVALLLRQDLAHMGNGTDKGASLASKPHDLVDPTITTPPDDQTGYLEIIEGKKSPDGTTPVDYWDSDTNQLDLTVGDIDDIIAFTASNPSTPYRGWINDTIAERTDAEIIWFMRGTTLYRRVRLIDPLGTDPDLNSKSGLAKREKRFGHTTGTFPFPLYTSSSSGWYYLRMPTIEETLSTSWSFPPTLTVPTLAQNRWDLWNDPYLKNWKDNNISVLDQKSGSLSSAVSNPRSTRAGEDIVLTNVISFDIKVWNPKAVPPRYVDLGEDSAAADPANFSAKSQQTELPYVFDSWSKDYLEGSPPEQPPYTEKLEGIEITIRCFDPRSQNVKQVRIVHRFEDK